MATDSSDLVPQGIGIRLLGWILLVSSLVTLALTLLQLFLDYRRDVHLIEGRLAEIERGYLDSIARSLWNVDGEQLRLQLEGLLRLPDMQALEIREDGRFANRPLTVSVGAFKGQAAIRREFPLVHRERGEARQLGVLVVEATLEGVYERLIDKALVILVSQGVKTFLVSLFILYIVYRLVTRHLETIARFLDRYEIRDEPAPPLALDRRPPPGDDELGRVVTAINGAHRRLEEAYRDQNKALDALTRSHTELKRYAYVASHDLQEPLRIISLYTQRLKRELEGKVGEPAGEYLDLVGDSGRRMHNLIRDLLAYSSIAEASGPFEPVALGEACHSAQQSLWESILETKARIDVGALPTLPADRLQVMQLFQNLLSNALKFHRPGAAPHIVVKAEEAGGEWVVSVADDGIGIEDSSQDVFQIFRRLHTAQAYPGTGVGLAICKRIVERHGGRIWLQSEPGRGTTVFFTLGGRPAPLES